MPITPYNQIRSHHTIRSDHTTRSVHSILFDHSVRSCRSCGVSRSLHFKAITAYHQIAPYDQIRSQHAIRSDHTIRSACKTDTIDAGTIEAGQNAGTKGKRGTRDCERISAPPSPSSSPSLDGCTSLRFYSSFSYEG